VLAVELKLEQAFFDVGPKELLQLLNDFLFDERL
jgi:hypothetical protein